MALMIYLLFSFLAAGGLAWILYEQVGRRAAWWGGCGTLVGFGLLGWLLVVVVRVVN